MTKTADSRPAFIQEVLGVCGFFLALFLLICLASFFRGDGAGRANWGGRVGFFLSHGLVSFMGLAALWLVVLILFISFYLFSPRMTLQRLPALVAGCSGIVLASSGLLGFLHFRPVAEEGYSAGGLLGSLLSDFFGRYLGAVGAGLFFTALLLVSIMGALRFSPYAAAAGLRLFCRDCLEKRRRNGGFSSRKNARQQRPATNEKAEKIVETAGGQTDAMPKLRQPVKKATAATEDEEFAPLPAAGGDFRLPGIALLDKPPEKDEEVDREHYFKVSRLLEEKLENFGVHGKVVGISPGPVVTTYEFAPAPGVKINKLVALADDLALGLKAQSVRIVGSIPGKAALGIEIPNPVRQIVYIRDILGTEEFMKSRSPLTIGLGMDVIGRPVTANLARMPHLLIAGATGAGKSVAVNAIICSMLMKATPEEVRLLMIDPKRIELSAYEDIPHLLHPVVVDPRLASRALQWAVKEMERRYSLMEEMPVKSLASYNEIAEEKLPLIVIIIDELADLMMVSSKEVEDAVARLAQMARAAGMHLILATQRPSVDVLTGLIKANFPTRMSFKVSSKVDSRTILDATGAEHLLGAGDMLFLAPGSSRLQRIHGAYISEKEIERIINFLKEQGRAVYDESVMRLAEMEQEGEGVDENDYDEKYDEAVALVCESGQASISMLQRRLRVGYNRAARMIEVMEKEGIVGPADGARPREVLARKTYDD